MMTEKCEDPERISRPPVGFVTVEDQRGVWGDALGTGELSELLFIDEVSSD